MTKRGALLWLLQRLRQQLEMAEFARHNDEAAKLDRRIQHVEKLLELAERA